MWVIWYIFQIALLCLSQTQSAVHRATVMLLRLLSDRLKAPLHRNHMLSVNAHPTFFLCGCYLMVMKRLNCLPTSFNICHLLCILIFSQWPFFGLIKFFFHFKAERINPAWCKVHQMCHQSLPQMWTWLPYMPFTVSVIHPFSFTNRPSGWDNACQ